MPLSEFIQQQNKSGIPFTAFLQQVATEHPYFTPAHFFALQQMDTAGNDYIEQAAKTALLFNNPYWLQFQLEHAGKETIGMTAGAAATGYENADNDDDMIPQAASEATVNAPALPAAQEEPPAAPTDFTAADDDNSGNDDDNAITVAAVETESPTHTETDEETDMKKKQAPLSIPLPILETTSTTALPAFEPMHLVDYFASQGIKLTDDLQTADKLGKQLKSFTEWLKTMKKLHPTDTGANAGAADLAIQVLAAKSNKEGDIVTEAMAEVLTQQGKMGKAIEMYQKLSLLNPAKSAFFAAKIEQLKGL